MSLIFISHSSRDNAAATQLRERLRALGHRSVFLDFDPQEGIPAGRDWEQELYRNLRRARAVIVLCSHHSMASRWCFVETTHARSLGKPLFPIKVDDCTLDGVLTDQQVIDLRVDPEDGYRRLALGLHAAGLDPADAFDWDGSRPPYPGLLAFQEEDAAVFFGRQEEIGNGLDLLNRVRRLGSANLVLVLGASGSGKSSLVRAGLVPRLRRDRDRWLVVGPFRPSSDPLRELAAALSSAFKQAGHDRPWRSIHEILRIDADAAPTSNPLLELASELRLDSGPSEARILVVVDQLEELLGRPEGHVASRFLALLGNALQSPESPLVVLGTLRSDFLGQLQNNPSLKHLRSESLSIGPLSEEDIAQSVEKPAELAGLTLEPGLVQALVAETRNGDALPLLAFTLRELYERYGRDGRLDLDEYQNQLGGLRGSVAKAADSLLAAERLTPADEDLLRTAFLAMVRLTEEGRHARRTARWQELPSAVHPLLEKFVQARLLVADGSAAERTLEVAHEALFHSWGRLHGWLDQAAEGLRLRREIQIASESWQLAGQPGEDLWRGGRLARARELIDSGDLPLKELDLEFVEASARTERAQLAAAETRRRRILQAVAAGAVLAVILAATATFFAGRASDARQEAERQAEAAEVRAKEAEIAEAQALAAQNFAEHQRVKERAAAATPGSDQAMALAAIAPKYLQQSKQHNRRAGALMAGLVGWRRNAGYTPEPPSSVLTLDVVQAKAGGAFIVLYGNPASPGVMLFDGGGPGVYKQSLRGRLDAIRQRWSAGQPLAIDLAVSTQTDIQHMRGLLDLLRELNEARAKGLQPLFELRGLWSNAFIPGDPEFVRWLAARWQKAALMRDALALGVPVNQPFSRLITRPEAGAARVEWQHGLTITILGPPVQWLREFSDFWLEDIRRRVSQGSDEDLPAPMEPVDTEILETFASPRIELLPSPIEVARFPTGGGHDRSVVNLASIVMVLELGGKRVLATADSRSDVLLASLEQAGYTDDRGNMEVDVLILPHGGSDRNVSVEFFRRVRARHYVASYDGTHRNPEPRTFEMLFTARRDDGQPFTIHLTYPPSELKEPYPVEQLCSVFDEAHRSGLPFEVRTPGAGERSHAIHLLAPIPGLDDGTTDRVCPSTTARDVASTGAPTSPSPDPA